MGPSVRIQTMHIAVASAGMMDRTRMAFGAEKKKTRYGETGRLIGSHAGINVDYQIKELCRSVFFLFLTCSFSWPSGYELDLEITGKMADQRESPPHFKKLARPLSVFPFFLQCD